MKEQNIRILKELLFELGLNTKQLAEIIGVSPQTLYDIQNPKKKNNISINIANKINKKFPVISVSYLLTGKGSLTEINDFANIIPPAQYGKIVENMSNAVLNNSEANKEFSESYKIGMQSFDRLTRLFETIITELLNTKK